MQPEYINNKWGSLRPNDMTVKEYAEYLGGISPRTIENWEYRGTNRTTYNLLMKITEQAEVIEELKQIIKDQNKVFQLPK